MLVIVMVISTIAMVMRIIKIVSVVFFLGRIMPPPRYGPHFNWARGAWRRWVVRLRGRHLWA